jgi:hypothetical protein
MEAHRFDVLLARAARQTTRRAALAALVGGALLLTGAASSEATKKAKRRKRRKCHARSVALNDKPIALWVDNTAGTAPITLTRGISGLSQSCVTINTDVVPAGERMWLAFPNSVAYMWIGLTQIECPRFNPGCYDPGPPIWPVVAPQFWLSFVNPMVGLPWVSASENGQTWAYLIAPRCFPLGQSVINEKELNQNEFVKPTMHGLVFHVRRNRDTNYKEFTVTLPAGLAAFLEASEA